METWPVSLPQLVLVDGYGETIDPAGKITSEPAMGPNKSRPRFTLPIGLFTTRIHISKDQKATLDDFYNRLLLQGTQKFNWVRPIEQTAIIFVFDNQIKYTPLGGNYYTAAMNLREIPTAP